MNNIQKISPCLWFDDQAEDAVTFYLGIFPKSKITNTAYYGEAGREFHGKLPSSVMTVAFELDGQSFTALNDWPNIQIQRSDFATGHVQFAGGSGPLLGKAIRGRG